MTQLLLSLASLAFVALLLSFYFEQINVGTINDFWAGAIFVIALIVAGSAMYVIKTSPRANRWRIVRTLRRRFVRMDRDLEKEMRDPRSRF